MPTAQASSVSASTVNKVDKKIAKVAATVVGNEEQQQATASTLPVTTGGNKTPPEQPEFIKQALIIIEKKVRNLEKRKIKLEEYKETQKKGTKLNEDQLLAVSKYEEVIRQLELSRELEKQFIGLANDAMKQQKKQSKKEQIEREEAIKDKLRESQKLLAVLDEFAKDETRADFLNEQNGATFKLTQKELDLLDDFSKLVQGIELGAKLESSATEAADHLLWLIESKNKPVQSLESNQVITYAELRKLFDRILNSGYWTKDTTVASTNAVPVIEEEVPVEQPQEQILNTNSTLANNTESQIQSNLIEPLSNLNVALEKSTDNLINNTAVFNQQNTSDDYVLVSPSNDFIENTSASNAQTKLEHSPSQQQQQQQQQPPKTFFTTLPDVHGGQHRNINEFINKCENSDEGINFLQDSEIQSRHQQHQQYQDQQLHHHQLQQHPDSYQTQMPQNNTFNNNYQEFNPNDQKDPNGGFKPRHNQGNRDYNNGQGGPRNYPPRQQRYSDERRSGGAGGMPRHNSGGNGGVPLQRQPSGGAPNNMPYNNSSNVNRGTGGGYRGGNNGMRTGGGPGGVVGQNVQGNNGGGGYRGGMRPNNGGGMPSNGPRMNNYRQDNNVPMHQQQAHVVQK